MSDFTGRLVFIIKKAPIVEQIKNWCTILCKYRTNLCDDCRKLGHELKLVLKQNDINKDVIKFVRSLILLCKF